MKDKLTIHPSPLEGTVFIPPSKSMAHRYLLGAALAAGESVIDNLELSKDIEATLRVLKGLGMEWQAEEGSQGRLKLRIKGLGGDFHLQERDFPCGESGSTLRFLIPLLLLAGEEAVVTGEGKLGERPLSVYYEIMESQGIPYETREGLLPLLLPEGRPRLSPGRFQVRGDISSQFITGLLYALPLLPGESLLEITTPLESRPYVDLTLAVLREYGIQVENQAYKSFRIPGSQTYRSGEYFVEGDWSQVAFFAVAAAIGEKPIACRGLSRTSLQGDRVIVDFLREMGGRVEDLPDGHIFHPSRTRGAVLDIRECPDLVPALTVLASLSEGETRIINGERLKIKESNRLESTSRELISLGARIRIGEDSLTIEGVESLRGGPVSSWNDHRVAMSLAAASSRCQGDLILDGPGSVAKSYPGFWEDFRKLGGRISE